eukprot:145323-Prorocentrum_lima.AAC.1
MCIRDSPLSGTAEAAPDGDIEERSCEARQQQEHSCGMEAQHVHDHHQCQQPEDIEAASDPFWASIGRPWAEVEAQDRERRQQWQTQQRAGGDEHSVSYTHLRAHETRRHL